MKNKHWPPSWVKPWTSVIYSSKKWEVEVVGNLVALFQEAGYSRFVILIIPAFLMWYCRRWIKTHALWLACIFLLVLYLLLCLALLNIVGIIPSPVPPLPIPPQLSQPCEVYTRTQLGDIAVYEPTPAQAYVENQRLTTAIEEAILQLTPEGIWILYSPTGGGKTTAITHVLHRLYVLGKIKVLKLRAGTFGDFIIARGRSDHLNLHSWLQFDMGCAHKFTSSDISDIFPYDKKQPRSVLFIDQFEIVTNDAELEEIGKMMHIFAVDIANRKNYIALVATANLDVFNAMLTWNGGEKFQAVVEGGFLWTPADFQAVVDAYKKKGFMAPRTILQPALVEAMRNTTTIRKFLRFLRDNKMVDFSRALAKPEL